ncbi:DUF1080 domain-containing protein [bacterium]|nr:DUF1080 domain-containing protein [bacterium]
MILLSLPWLFPLVAAENDAHPLIDQELSKWTSLGKAEWKVEKGVLFGGQFGDPKKSGLLTTKKMYQDFELSMEFMIDEHGKYNSGVYLRNQPGSARMTGYQVNIGRGAAEEYVGLYRNGWLDKGDEKDDIRKVLKWNQLRIRARGPHIEVWLNGIQIVDYTDPKPAPELLNEGTIGLQTYGAEGHAGWVKFRKITIKELETK